MTNLVIYKTPPAATVAAGGVFNYAVLFSGLWDRYTIMSAKRELRTEASSVRMDFSSAETVPIRITLFFARLTAV